MGGECSRCGGTGYYDPPTAPASEVAALAIESKNRELELARLEAEVLAVKRFYEDQVVNLEAEVSALRAEVEKYRAYCVEQVQREDL